MVFFIANHTDLFYVEPDAKIHRGSLVDVCRWLDVHFIFGCDTETEGMMNYKNKVIMLQIGDDKTQFVIDTRGLDISCLKKYLITRWSL